MAVEVSQGHINQLPNEIVDQITSNDFDGVLNFPEELFSDGYLKMKLEDFQNNRDGELSSCRLSVFGYLDGDGNLVTTAEGGKNGFSTWQFKSGWIKISSLSQFFTEEAWEKVLDKGLSWVQVAEDYADADSKERMSALNKCAVVLYPRDDENGNPALQFSPAPGFSQHEKPIWVMRNPTMNSLEVLGGESAQMGTDASKGKTISVGGDRAQSQSKPQSPKQSPKQSPLQRRGRKTRKTVKAPEQSENDIPS